MILNETKVVSGKKVNVNKKQQILKTNQNINKICRFYVKGYCKFGNRCKNIHKVFE